MTRLVQLKHPRDGRRVARVDGNRLRFIKGAATIYELAQMALRAEHALESFVAGAVGMEELDYDAVHARESEWHLLAAFDDPDEPARCLITGTGLTHRKSAENRQAMHSGENVITDSMRMYQWGLEG